MCTHTHTHRCTGLVYDFYDTCTLYSRNTAFSRLVESSEMNLSIVRYHENMPM